MRFLRWFYEYFIIPSPFDYGWKEWFKRTFILYGIVIFIGMIAFVIGTIGYAILIST